MRKGEPSRGGRRRAQGAAISRGNQIRNLSGDDLSLAAGDKHSRDIAHHLFEKAVRPQRQAQGGGMGRQKGRGRQKVNTGLQHGTHIAFRIRAGVAERGKAVPPAQG